MQTPHSALFLLALASVSASAAPAPNDAPAYTFTSSKYTIEVRVQALPPYRGEPFRLYNPATGRQDLCLSLTAGSDACTPRFVGAVALVTYTIRLANGKAPSSEILHELVTDTGHSPELPELAPFAKSVPFHKGIASDIQLFGYDETPIPPAGRDPERIRSAPMQRTFRQELFIGSKREPFAVIEWRHTLDSIRILRVTPLPTQSLSLLPHTSLQCRVNRPFPPRIEVQLRHNHILVLGIEPNPHLGHAAIA